MDRKSENHRIYKMNENVKVISAYAYFVFQNALSSDPNE